MSLIVFSRQRFSTSSVSSSTRVGAGDESHRDTYLRTIQKEGGFPQKKIERIISHVKESEIEKTRETRADGSFLLQ